MLPFDAELYVRLTPLTDADHRQIIRNKCNPLQRIKVSFNTQLNAIASYVMTRMANNSVMPNFTVELSVQRLNSHVQVPLSITLSELMLITSSPEEQSIYYSFRPTADNFSNVCKTQSQGYIPTQSMMENMNMNANLYYNSCMSSGYAIKQSPFQASCFATMENNSSVSSPEISDVGQYSGNGIGMNATLSSPGNRGINLLQTPKKNNWTEIPTSPSCSLFHAGISMYTDSFGTMPPSFNGSLSIENERGQSKESIQLRQQLEAMIHNQRQLGAA